METQTETRRRQISREPAATAPPVPDPTDLVPPFLVALTEAEIMKAEVKAARDIYSAKVKSLKVGFGKGIATKHIEALASEIGQKIGKPIVYLSLTATRNEAGALVFSRLNHRTGLTTQALADRRAKRASK